MNLKAQIDNLLRERNFESLVRLCEKERHAWQEVKYRLYSLDEVIRWSAIETTGKLMEYWWKKGDEEKVRVYIRTLFWSMNDESGGIGWSSPQTVAEIISNIPEIIDPYGSMMIAHCIDEPPLIKGCLWGIGRLGVLIADSVEFFKNQIFEIFNSQDPEIIGLACWAMGRTKFILSKSYVEKNIFIDNQIKIYINGKFIEKPVSFWAKEALANFEYA
jgi:hypothetical protein